MLVTARTAGFLLLLVLASTFLVQAGKRNLIDVNARKGEEITSEYKNAGQNTVRCYDLMEMEKIGKRSGKYYTRKLRMLMSEDGDGGRFVAFNADYKGPRRHPPKNN